MFYNTKIIPLFRTNSNIWQKSMFYNIFLDLYQKYEDQTRREVEKMAEKGKSDKVWDNMTEKE